MFLFFSENRAAFDVVPPPERHRSTFEAQKFRRLARKVRRNPQRNNALHEGGENLRQSATLSGHLVRATSLQRKVCRRIVGHHQKEPRRTRAHRQFSGKDNKII